MTFVMISLYPWQVFSMCVNIGTHFRFALIDGNLTAQLTESHRGIGGGIQIPEM